MSDTKKQIEIITGPRGSGKTTFARAYFKIRNCSFRFINAEAIAVGLSLKNPERTASAARKVMLSAIRKAIDKGESLAFESTLAKKEELNLLRKARSKEYSVRIYFLYLNNSSLNLQRIRKRIKEGGHAISKPTVVKTSPQSFVSFWNKSRLLCDDWIVFDNCGTKPRPIQNKANFNLLSDKDKTTFEKAFLKIHENVMNKKVKLPKDLKRAIDLFPRIVEKNKTAVLKRNRFIKKTFGDLARKVHKQARTFQRSTW